MNADDVIYDCVCMDWDKEFPSKIVHCDFKSYYTFERSILEFLKFSYTYDWVQLNSKFPGENGEFKYEHDNKGKAYLHMQSDIKHSEHKIDITVYVNSNKYDIDFIRNHIKDSKTTGITSDHGYVVFVYIWDTRE